MSDKPKVVELSKYQEEVVTPPELITILEDVLDRAKNGQLRTCILAFEGTTSEPNVNEGAQYLWRSDGRLDAIHSDCHLLAHHALLALLGVR